MLASTPWPNESISMNVIQSSLWAALVLAGTACASHPIQQRHVDAVPVQRSMAITAVDNVCAPVESTEVSEDLCGIDDNVVVRDPWERYNRRIHRLNGVVDRHVLGNHWRSATRRRCRIPSARGCRASSTTSISPATAVNQTLQGQPLHALQSMGRFAVNTTVGIGGLFDPATRFKMPGNDDEDFGKTLATWGWRDSRYLVIPLLGPAQRARCLGLRRRQRAVADRPGRGRYGRDGVAGLARRGRTDAPPARGSRPPGGLRRIRAWCAMRGRSDAGTRSIAIGRIATTDRHACAFALAGLHGGPSTRATGLWRPCMDRRGP